MFDEQSFLEQSRSSRARARARAGGRDGRQAGTMLKLLPTISSECGTLYRSGTDLLKSEVALINKNA